MKEENKEILFGLVLFVVCVMSFAFIANKSHAPEDADKTDKYIVEASFGRTDGLHPGDKVRIAGLNVGEVVKAELMPDFRVHLTMLLDKNYKIPDDSSITIESDSLMGAKYLEISPGGDDMEIPSGGQIYYTQDSMVLEDLIDLVINYAKSKQAQASFDSQKPKEAQK
ncbi:MAG: MCE family protein [Alphaproteobacteria bacterium]|nr:MCE family protein [Alphaproteobacteria bacterium]